MKVADAARNYLAVLHRDPTAPLTTGIDGEAPAWAEAFLEAIREYRDSFPGSEARNAARALGLRNTRDKHRFFWELWQNADDARASRLTFTICPGYLIVENNGDPFTARDVYSACFVASSQKRGRADMKGHYGVGFLSLMRVCPEPSLYSGNWAFRLTRDFTYPSAVPAQDFVDGTRIVVPLEQGELEAVRQSLTQRLEEEVLLYMAHLRTVEIIDKIDGSTRRIQTEEAESTPGGSLVILRGTPWRRYWTTVQAPEDLARSDNEPIAGELPIVLARAEGDKGPHRVASFFPTEVRHSLPWRFSAPLEVTTGREELLDSDYNDWLLARVGEAMADAAIDRQVGDPERPWRLVPNKSIDEKLEPLYAAAHERLRLIPWLPADGQPRRPAEVAVPASPQLRALVKPADVSNEDVQARIWLSEQFEREYTDLVVELGAYLICCHELSEVLGQVVAIETRTPEWRLQATAETIRLMRESRHTVNEVRKNLLDGSCFLNRDGQQFSLAGAQREGKLVCRTRTLALGAEVARVAEPLLVVLHNVYWTPEDQRRSESNALRESVSAWLEEQAACGAARYHSRLRPEHLIRRFIVDGRPGSLERLDDRTHDALLGFVAAHVAAYKGVHLRDPRWDEIGKKLRAKSSTRDSDGRQTREYRPLADAYLGRHYDPNSPWAKAAGDIPGIWWLGSAYRRELKPSDEAVKVAEFLRWLGVREAPRLVPVLATSRHGTHSFAPVTRGDREAHPHFPHDSPSYQSWQTAFGTVGDYVSPDLQAVLDCIDRLEGDEIAAKGQALMECLEQHWSQFRPFTKAQAYAYYSNGSHSLGEMPTRWLHSLRAHQWVECGDGAIRSPNGLFAATEAVLDVVGPKDAEVCAWPCKNAIVAEELGMRARPTARLILERLRRGRDAGGRLSRAVKIYAALSEFAWDSSVTGALRNQKLIYYPSKDCNWWRAAQCLRGDYRDLFGDRRAYLSVYPEAERLWQQLGIPTAPTIEMFREYWDEVAQEEPDAEELERLERTYRVADPLCHCATPAVISLWTDQGWAPSNTVAATASDELWAAVAEGIPRWGQAVGSALQTFCRWSGVTLLDQVVRYGQPQSESEPNEPDSQTLRAAVSNFAEEVAREDPALWESVEPLARIWIEMEVARADEVTLPVEVQLPGNQVRSGALRAQAYKYETTLYLARATRLREPQVVEALLRDNELDAGQLRQVKQTLRLHLIDAEDSGTTHVQPLPVGPKQRPEVPHDLFEDEDDDEVGGEDHRAEDDGPSGKEPSRGTPRSTAPKPPQFDATAFVAEIKLASGDKPIGGPVDVAEINLRPPQRGRVPGGAGGVAGPRLSNKQVEARGLKLFVAQVLKPRGIHVQSQTSRPGVGADLACDDGVYRELKTFSGPAQGTIKLTAYEHALAEAAPEQYELVVVENLEGNPRIIRIPDPLNTLHWRPSGGVEVLEWRSNETSFERIELRRKAP